MPIAAVGSLEGWLSKGQNAPMSIKERKLRVSLSSSSRSSRDLKLVWTERGGPPVHQPANSGFGTRLIKRTLAADLRASVRLDFNHEGLRCEVTATVPEVQNV